VGMLSTFDDLTWKSRASLFCPSLVPTSQNKNINNRDDDILKERRKGKITHTDDTL